MQYSVSSYAVTQVLEWRAILPMIFLQLPLAQVALIKKKANKQIKMEQ